MSKKKELCPHCGASMMINKYTLNVTLLNALSKLARNPGKMARECGFDQSEYSVYTKLKYWGFITQLDDGIWLVTNKGREFLTGTLSAPREVQYFRDEIVGFSSDTTTAFQILPTEESKQKYREYMEPYYE